MSADPVEAHVEQRRVAKHRNFLENHVVELRHEAKKQRALAQRLSEEKSNCERVALERLQQAHRLECEADAVVYCILLIKKSEQRRMMRTRPVDAHQADIDEAAELIRATPPDHGHDRLVYRMIADAAIGTVTLMTWDQLCEATQLGVNDIAKSLDRLEQAGYLDTLAMGTGNKPMKWAVK